MQVFFSNYWLMSRRIFFSMYMSQWMYTLLSNNIRNNRQQSNCVLRISTRLEDTEDIMANVHTLSITNYSYQIIILNQFVKICMYHKNLTRVLRTKYKPYKKTIKFLNYLKLERKKWRLKIKFYGAIDKFESLKYID